MQFTIFAPLAIFSSSSSLGGKMCKYASIFSPHLPLERQFNQWAIFLLRYFWLLDNLTDNWVVKFFCNQGERTRAGLKIGALREGIYICPFFQLMLCNGQYIFCSQARARIRGSTSKGVIFPNAWVAHEWTLNVTSGGDVGMRTNSFDRRFHDSADSGNPTISLTERPAALALWDKILRRWHLRLMLHGKGTFKGFEILCLVKRSHKIPEKILWRKDWYFWFVSKSQISTKSKMLKLLERRNVWRTQT